MKYKIAIVEDDKDCSKLIADYVESYSKESGEKFELYFFDDGDGIAEKYKPIYDVIFLDIQMKLLDGMATAEYIRKLDDDVIIIFITNMSQYAIKGYSVEALSFLLKPVPYFAFSQELRKCVEKLKRKKDDFLLVSTTGGNLRIRVADILFIEILNHKLIINTRNGEIFTSGTIKDMEKKLSGSNQQQIAVYRRKHFRVEVLYELLEKSFISNLYSIQLIF